MSGNKGKGGPTNLYANYAEQEKKRAAAAAAAQPVFGPAGAAAAAAPPSAARVALYANMGRQLPATAQPYLAFVPAGSGPQIPMSEARAAFMAQKKKGGKRKTRKTMKSRARRSRRV